LKERPLHDFVAESKSWVPPLSDTNSVEPPEALRLVSPRPTALRRIGRAIPRRWRPSVRSLSSVASHLPAGVRYRLHRLLGLSRPDMGDIERDYPAWIALYDRIDDDARRGILAQISRMRHSPLISVLMPVFNPPPEHLLAAIRSVQDQLYPCWELCIGDDASTDPAVTEILRNAARHDSRIKLERRERNGHISAASNSALRQATGSFLALLDHDDVLPPHALYEVATRIIAQPEVDIIYSDEDHIDDGGRRSHPYFKPDWNPDLMLGQNLISHLGVYRRALVEQIGGFRTGFEGSQDYDLALRVVAETRPERIAHIPKVLYHWRQGAADRTFSQASHDRCVQNGRRAVSEFVRHAQPDARIEAAPFVAGWTRVVYPMPEPAPLVSIIVSGPVSADALLCCVDSVLSQTDYPALEILIAADDASALPGRVARDSRVRRIAGHRPLWTNLAAEQAHGSLLLLLDPHLSPGGAGWLREMVSQAVRPDVGAVGAKLLCPDGTVRHAGTVVGGRHGAFTPFWGRQRAQNGYFGHLQLARDVTAVSGECLMVQRQAFLAVGGFDEILSLSAFGDVDLCLRLAEIGYRTVWTPYAELCVRDGAPRQGRPATQSKRATSRMRQRWGHDLDIDRYWSPNLASDPREVALAFPPRTGTSKGRSGGLANAADRLDPGVAVSSSWPGDGPSHPVQHHAAAGGSG
jgi:GT2 family glycosyltransferase